MQIWLLFEKNNNGPIAIWFNKAGSVGTVVLVKLGAELMLLSAGLIVSAPEF